ncbi:MAG: hypothetical protein JWO33_2806 [Caulobacteraceae bacterium]|nr:hypothetical protein [Caulobacteraceae bacterium]
MIGTLVGAGLTFFPAAGPISEGAALESFGAMLSYAPLTFTICAICWFAGIVTLGVPVWLILQRLKRDSFRASLIAGALLVIIPLLTWGLEDELRISREVGQAFRWDVVFDLTPILGAAGLAGMIVAGSIWWAAYRREAEEAVLQLFD